WRRPRRRRARRATRPLDAPFASGPVAVAHDPARQLARLGAGELVDELHLPRRLVGGEAATAVGEQLAGIGSGADDHGVHALTPLVVGHANHAAVVDAWVA